MDAALRLCVRNFGALFAVALASELCAYALDVALETRAGEDVGTLVSLVVGAAFSPLLIGTTLAAVEGRGTVAWGALRRLWPVGVVYLIANLAGIVGLVLLIVPGVILLTKWSVAPVVALAEGRRVRDSFRRSAGLVRGLFWHVLGALTCWWGAVAAELGVDRIETLLLPHAPRLVEFLKYVTGAFFAPLSACVAVMLYMDLLARKEGADLLDPLPQRWPAAVTPGRTDPADV